MVVTSSEMRRMAALGLALLLAAATPALAQARDADGDGMPNAWERSHDLDPHDASDGARDPDRDHLVDVLEYQRDGDPHDADTDDDGLRDGAEVRRWESLVDVADEIVGRVSCRDGARTATPTIRARYVTCSPPT